MADSVCLPGAAVYLVGCLLSMDEALGPVPGTKRTRCGGTYLQSQHLRMEAGEQEVQGYIFRHGYIVKLGLARMCETPKAKQYVMTMEG